MLIGPAISAPLGVTSGLGANLNWMISQWTFTWDKPWTVSTDHYGHSRSAHIHWCQNSAKVLLLLFNLFYYLFFFLWPSRPGGPHQVDTESKTHGSPIHNPRPKTPDCPNQRPPSLTVWRGPQQWKQDGLYWHSLHINPGYVPCVGWQCLYIHTTHHLCTDLRRFLISHSSNIHVNSPCCTGPGQKEFKHNPQLFPAHHGIA